MNLEKLFRIIPKENVLLEEPMSKHTTFKVGGPAEAFVKCNTVEQIQNVIAYCNEEEINLTIIGNGSNVLVKDEGIRGIVLKICLDNYKIEEEKNCAVVTVGAGMQNAKFAYMLLDKEYSGYEFAVGIPGTIGGAIKMNAGAYGFEIKDIVQEVKYIDIKDNKIKVIKNNDMEFGYRHSIFKNKKVIILEATFKFKKDKKEQIKKIMEENMQSRIEKQPLEPSAGSTFKRGENFITSKLIDECGLKGTSVGDAEVSTKHAGFIVNKGNASANDILELIKLVKETVLEKTGKEIELEIEIL